MTHLKNSKPKIDRRPSRVRHEMTFRNLRNRLRSIRSDEATEGVNLVKYLIKNENNPKLKQELGRLGLLINRLIL